MEGLPAPFAVDSDYTARGHDGAAWGQTLDMKLEQASRLIRSHAPWIDQWIEDSQIDRGLVTDIACEMVARAAPLTDMGVPLGATSAQVGVDVFQRSLQFGGQTGGGAGALYLSKNEKRSLGITGQKAFTIKVGADVT